MSKIIQNYYQIYEEIEKEVLNLTFNIYFDDSQIDVYSTKILDLIVRCCIEIESLIRDLYERENSIAASSVGAALNFLDNIYNLKYKKIIIYSKFFHFSNDRIEMYPFNYFKNSSEDYYKTYCALKHDRCKNIKKATIRTLIRALGVLYILNIYYRNERFVLDSMHATNYDYTCGSKIFRHILYPYQYILSQHQASINRSNCIYEVVRHENHYSIRIKYINDMDEEDETTIVTGQTIFQNFVKERNLRELDLGEFLYIMSIITKKTENEVLTSLNEKLRIKHILKISTKKMKSSYVATIVKN